MPVPAKTKVGNLKCTFEFLKSSEKEITAFNEPLKTVYNSINDYYLYLFKKDNSGSYSLCWNYDQEPARKSSEQGSNGLYLCDFTFERGKRYYGYFSGKKINKDSIDHIKTTGSYKLIEITPRGSGQIRIDHSLFYWISLVQFIEDRIADKSTLLENLIKIYDEDNFTISGVEDTQLDNLIDEFKLFRIVFFHGSNFMDISYLLKGIKSALNNELPLYEQMLNIAEENTAELLNNKDLYPMGKCYNLDSAWNKEANKSAPYTKLLGAMHGFMLCKKYGEILAENKTNLISIIEDYFYYVDSEKELKDFFSSN